MAKNYRKPVPKSQKEISKNLQTPTDSRMGNPNAGSTMNWLEKIFSSFSGFPVFLDDMKGRHLRL